VAALLALNTASTEASALTGEAEIMLRQRIDALEDAHDAVVGIQQRFGQRMDALNAAHDAVVGIEQIAPDRLFDLACEAHASATRLSNEDASAFTRRLIKLRKAMRYDLRGADIPSPEELDRMADTAIELDRMWDTAVSNTTTFLAKGDASARPVT
jgi:hypothetical protein